MVGEPIYMHWIHILSNNHLRIDIGVLYDIFSTMATQI